MKTRLGGRTWAALLTFGLFGQIAWVIENMYFNVFLYNTISGDTSMIAAMVAWSAATATVLGRQGVPVYRRAIRHRVWASRAVSQVCSLRDSARVECIRLHRVIYFMRASKALKGYSMAIRLLFFTIPAPRALVKPFFLARRRAILQGDIKSTSAPVRGERGTLWKSSKNHGCSPQGGRAIKNSGRRWGCAP